MKNVIATNSLDTIRDILRKTGKRISNDYAMTDHGKQLLKTARKHRIPYDEHQIDWLSLIDYVNESAMFVKKNGLSATR